MKALVIGLVVPAVVLAGGAAAAATGAAPGVDVLLGPATVAAGGPALEIGPSWYATEPVALANPALTYQLAAGLTGVTLSAGDGVGTCENATPRKLVCTDPFELETGPTGSSGWFPVKIKAGARATPGATGTLTATFTADGIAPIVTRAPVRVGEAVNLATVRQVAVSAAPGANFQVPTTVRNAGSTVAHGAAAVFFTDRGFEAAQKYGNCRYSGDRLRSCVFDQDVAPGATLTAAVPYRLRADTAAPSSEYGEVQWQTPAELADRIADLTAQGYDVGVPGDGPDLVLAAPRRSLAAIPQTDPRTGNNWSTVTVTVTGSNPADFAAVGTTLTGREGDEVTATVGIDNVGTGSADFSRSGESVAQLRIRIPNGTTVVRAPGDCSPEGGLYWICRAGSYLAAGDGVRFDLRLRVGLLPLDAYGDVTVNPACECPQWPDPSVGNNTALIRVNGWPPVQPSGSPAAPVS